MRVDGAHVVSWGVPIAPMGARALLQDEGLLTHFEGLRWVIIVVSAELKAFIARCESDEAPTLT